jgi:hypothetical protein
MSMPGCASGIPWFGRPCIGWRRALSGRACTSRSRKRPTLWRNLIAASGTARRRRRASTRSWPQSSSAQRGARSCGEGLRLPLRCSSVRGELTSEPAVPSDRALAVAECRLQSGTPEVTLRLLAPPVRSTSPGCRAGSPLRSSAPTQPPPPRRPHSRPGPHRFRPRHARGHADRRQRGAARGGRDDDRGRRAGAGGCDGRVVPNSGRPPVPGRSPRPQQAGVVVRARHGTTPRRYWDRSRPLTAQALRSLCLAGPQGLQPDPANPW